MIKLRKLSDSDKFDRYTNAFARHDDSSKWCLTQVVDGSQIYECTRKGGHTGPHRLCQQGILRLWFDPKNDEAEAVLRVCIRLDLVPW